MSAPAAPARPREAPAAPELAAADRAARELRQACLLAAGVVALYALALSDFYKPGAYDSTVYMSGAKSLVRDGTYRNVDMLAAPYIIGFPPLLSAVLAPAALFARTVLAAKVILLAVVGGGVLAIWSFVRVEMGHRRALVAAACTSLLLEAYLWGTTISSEWLYIAASFLFLSWARTVAMRDHPAGLRTTQVVLGAALLVLTVHARYMGVAMFAGCALQVLADGWRARSLRRLATHPLTRVGALAAILTATWGLRCVLLSRAGLGQPTAYQEGARILTVGLDDLRVLAGGFGNLFLSADRIARVVPWAELPLHVLGAALAGVMLVGMARKARQGWLLREGYFVALCAVTVLVTWKEIRYLLPLAPLAISYFLVGLERVVPDTARRRQVLGALVGGLALLWVAQLGGVLLRGDGDSYRGLLAGRHARASEIYLGEWRDVAVVSEWLGANLAPQESFAGATPEVKFLAAISSRRAANPLRSTAEAHWPATRYLVTDARTVDVVPAAWARAFPTRALDQGRFTVWAR
jgi:hypothetical protein